MSTTRLEIFEYLKTNRRQFLRAAATGDVAASAPPVLAEPKAVKKYRTALIGSGWGGMNILNEAIAAGENHGSSLQGFMENDSVSNATLSISY